MSESRYLDYALDLYRAGDLSGAEEALRVLLRTHHSRAQASLLLASIKFRTGKPERAVQLLRDCLDDRACTDRLLDYYVGERMNAAALEAIAERSIPANDASALVDQALKAQLTGNLPGALAHCQSALSLQPDYPRALNQYGRCLFNARREREAMQAFERATTLAPDHVEAWHNLGHVLRATGQVEKSVEAYRRSLELAPAYRSALLNLGILLLGAGRNEEALERFSALCTLAPEHAEGWLNQGLCLHVLRRLEEARPCYERAIELDPRNPLAHRHLGSLCAELIDTEGALRHYRDALALNPRDADLAAELVALLERANRLREAREAVDQGLKIQPGDPNLLFEAARLDRRDGETAAGLAKLRAIQPQRLHPRLHSPYWFELGTALDRIGDSAEAYAAFVRGNELAMRSPRARATDAGAFDRQMDAVEAWLAVGAPAQALENDEDGGEDLCFLLGFPRSGTTLLDVMIDGHPQASSIEERPTVERIAFAVDSSHGGYPQGLMALDRAGRDALRLRYRELAAAEGAAFGEGRIVVDKMPIRTVHACFMHRLFPRAKFLFALRHPCDVVLSNFMQQFAINEVFLHFDSLQEGSRIYDRVMTIWQRTLTLMPLPLHYVRYESLVADTGAELRAACDFLGLPWIEGLDTHQKNLAGRGRIRTNSYHQVAEPVYLRALDRWKRYREPLQPHLDRLRPHAAYFGYRID